ncbi:MAG: ABC transporter substrate-binding protein [Burkholderiales bacterium]
MRKSALNVAHISAWILASAFSLPVCAEVSELRISKQYGLPYLNVVIVEQQQLIEKHAKARGIDLKVSWVTIGSGGTSTDSLLAGNLDFVTSGMSNMLLLWSRTGGQVKALSAVAAVPLILVTRNPNIKTIADFTEKDKIAVPTVKVSMQSTILGIAAEKLFGEKGRTKLDAFTVAMSHPDGTIALLSGGGEVNSHFSAPPYQYLALKAPGVHAVLNSTDVMGGPATITVIFGTVKFHDSNPTTIAALYAALGESAEFIAKNKRAAAELYLKATKEKISVDELVSMLDLPTFVYAQAPNGTLKYAEYMFKTGVIKTRPTTWKDAFFPESHLLPGS